MTATVPSLEALPGPLVTPEWIEEHLPHPGLRVVDVHPKDRAPVRVVTRTAVALARGSAVVAS